MAIKTKLLLLIILCFTALHCQPAQKADFLLVIFAPGDAVLVREGARLELKTGMVLKQADSIETGQNPVDLQNSYGGSIRLGARTLFSVQSLLEKGTQVRLGQGSLLARLRKGEKDQRFSVVTPTAIAGVRGTTFKVEVDSEGASELRVLEGSVAFSPQVEAVPALSADLAAQETVVEGPAAASLTPAALIELARVRSAAQKGEKVQLQLVGASVIIEKRPLSKQEELEARTLVAVDASLAREARQKEGEKAAEIASAYEARVDQAVEAMKKDAPVLSEAELQKEYATLETAVMRSGEQKKGVTVAQAGSTLIMHTPAGIIRLAIRDIEYIDLNY